MVPQTYIHVDTVQIFCAETKQTFLVPISFAVLDETKDTQPTVYVRRFSRYRVAQHAMRKAASSANPHLKLLYGNETLQFRDYMEHLVSDCQKTVVKTSEGFVDLLYSLISEKNPRCAQSFLLSQLLGLRQNVMERVILPKADFLEYQNHVDTPANKVLFLVSAAKKKTVESNEPVESNELVESNPGPNELVESTAGSNALVEQNELAEASSSLE